MNVLLLNDFGTKRALKHPELAGLPLLGRGKFSTVYDNGDTVLHMTCDPVGYALHCDGVMSIAGKSKHFSRVVNDFGDIGEQAQGDLTIYLFETEKLAKLTGFPEARREVRQIIKAIDTLYMQAEWSLKSTHFTPQIVMGKLAADKQHSLSMRKAFSLLENFVPNYENSLMDMHYANFMVRPSDGTVVLNDPLVDMRVWNDATNRLRARYNMAAAA